MRLVSIVIPCFNSGRFLDEAIQSALAQTYQNVEVIVVDDGSTDPETINLLATASWPRTRIFHQANAGPAAARNHAIREALGEYILPLDADDTIEPGYVAAAVRELDAKPEVGVVYCHAMKFGAETGPWKLPDYTLRELVIDNVIFVTALYRKTDWATIGGYNETLRRGVEDYEFWVKMVGSGRDVVQLDGYLFNYRIQQQSRTVSFQEERDSVVATYAAIFRANRDFFAEHAEFLFEHRLGIYDQLNYWRGRYASIDAFFERHRLLLSVARKTNRAFRRLCSFLVKR